MTHTFNKDISKTFPRETHPASDSESISDFRRALPQFCVVGVKNLILLGWGLILGFPTILIPGLQAKNDNATSEIDFVLTNDEISWIGSINLLCVPFGSITSGLLMDPVGKRRMMQILNIPMLVAWALFYFASDITQVYIALGLSGMSGGLLEAPLLIYIAETIEPRFRGMLTASGTATVLGGVCLQFIIGSMLHWRTVAAISAIIPFLAFNAVFLVPETPYWLYAKNRIDDAHKSLQWLRGRVPFNGVADEFQGIVCAVENAKAVSKAHAAVGRQQYLGNKVKPFAKRSFVLPFLLIAVGFVFGHFSGMTPLQTYSIQILSSYSVPINEYYATICLGAAQVIGCLLGMVCVRSSGKRRLVFMSFIGCGVCFFAVATQSHYLHGSYQRDFNTRTNSVDASIENLEQNVFDVILTLRDRPNNDSMNQIMQIVRNETHPSFYENEDGTFNTGGGIRQIDVDVLDKILQLHEIGQRESVQMERRKFNASPENDVLFSKSHAINNNNATQVVANWTTESGIDVEKLFGLLNISKYIIGPFMGNEENTMLTQVNKIELNIWDILASNSTDIQTTSHLPEIVNELSAALSTFAKRIANEFEIDNSTESQRLDRWMPLIILLSGSMFAHCGAKLFPWMLIGEVYPMEVRAASAGVSSAIGYLIGFLSNKLFLSMVAALTLNGTFWFYSAVAFVACFVLYFTLPETENKTLEEIQAFFDQSKRNHPNQIDIKTNQMNNMQLHVDV